MLERFHLACRALGFAIRDPGDLEITAPPVSCSRVMASMASRAMREGGRGRVAVPRPTHLLPETKEKRYPLGVEHSSGTWNSCAKLRLVA